MHADPTPLNYLDETAGFRRFVVWVQWLILIATVIAFGAVALATPDVLNRYVPPTAMGLVLLLSHLRLRYSARSAVLVLVIGAWLLAAGAALMFSGIHTSAIIIFPFSIAMAGWVLGGRWLAVMSIVTLVFLVVLGGAEINGAFHPTPRSGALPVLLTLVSLITVTSFLTYAARRNLLDSRDRALTLSRDMAQQHAASAERERDLNILLNNVPAGIASFDADGRLRRCNLQYAQSLGLEPQAIVGKRFAEYLPPDVAEQVTGHWDKELSGDSHSYRRAQRDAKTGELRWVDVSVLSDYDDGVLVGQFAVFLDVTDKVRAENAILELNTQLEQRVARRTAELALAMETLQESREELVRSQARATLSVLVASVSHELSTPIGNSALVASSLREVSKQLQHQLDTGQLKKSTLLELNSMLATGGQLLESNLERARVLIKNFKQVSADQASEQRRTFDLAEVVAEVVSSLSPSLKNTPHTIMQSIAPGIVMDSFPGPLGQVAINLINNAYLHAFEGRSDGVLRITAECNPDSVHVRFSDNGVGMSPSVQLHLFDPFFSTKVGKGGTGLGMSIVDSLVRKTLGGSVQVQSAVGSGTTFELLLPLVAPAEALIADPAPLGLV